AVARRSDPHVLDGTAFKDTLEADLPVMPPRAAVEQESLGLGFPSADELVVEMHAPSLGARRALRCQNLADVRAARTAPQLRRGDAETAAKADGEVAVAGEAGGDADGGEIARGIEPLVERRRHACPEVVAVQRHAGELAERARKVPGRAVHPPRQRGQAPGL